MVSLYPDPLGSGEEPYVMKIARTVLGKESLISTGPITSRTYGYQDGPTPTRALALGLKLV
jgi:hypothetical protein